jgi:hypothetical protein
VKINDYLSGFMRLSGNINLNKTTGYANADIYNHIFNLPPTMYGPLTPSIDADGKDQVVLYIQSIRAMKKLPPSRNVQADARLVASLQAKFGTGNVKVVEKSIEKRA